MFLLVEAYDLSFMSLALTVRVWSFFRLLYVFILNTVLAVLHFKDFRHLNSVACRTGIAGDDRSG